MKKTISGLFLCYIANVYTKVYTIKCAWNATITKQGCDVMNLRGLMKKLQTALLTVGIVVKVNTTQWYSNEQNRIINQYIVVTQVSTKDKKGNWKNIEYEILKTCSPVEVIQCLGDVYKAVK